MYRQLTRPLVLAVGLLLAACSNTPPPEDKFPPVSFAGQPPFVFNVAKVEIVSKFVSSSTPPHIELIVPVSPESALKRWAEDRIKPKGTSGTLRVLINDASATETPLKKEEGASSLFTKQETSRIDVSVEMVLQMLDERQFVKSSVNGKVAKSRTLTEGLKLNERDKILYDMVVDVVRDMGAQVDPLIQNTFAPWMVLQ